MELLNMPSIQKDDNNIFSFCVTSNKCFVILILFSSEGS